MPDQFLILVKRLTLLEHVREYQHKDILTECGESKSTSSAYRCRQYPILVVSFVTTPSPNLSHCSVYMYAYSYFVSNSTSSIRRDGEREESRPSSRAMPYNHCGSVSRTVCSLNYD